MRECKKCGIKGTSIDINKNNLCTRCQEIENSIELENSDKNTILLRYEQIKSKLKEYKTTFYLFIVGNIITGFILNVNGSNKFENMSYWEKFFELCKDLVLSAISFTIFPMMMALLAIIIFGVVLEDVLFEHKRLPKIIACIILLFLILFVVSAVI